MTAPLVVDRDAASRLAELDPSVAPLEAALAAPQLGPDVLLHDLCWTPGDGCRLVFRTRRHTEWQFLAVTVDADGWSHRDYRDDPALPGLRLGTEPQVVADLLAAVLGSPVTGVRIEPVRYRAGARCVVRYDAETTAGSRTVYAKILAPDGFADLARLATALDGAPVWSRLGARLVGTWPELAAVLTGGVPGVAASAVLRDPSVPLAARARVAHALGTVLAALHSVDGVDVPPRSPEDQVAAVQESATALVTVDAALGDRVLGLLHRLGSQPPTQASPVLCHGGFRAGQVIVSESNRLTVLDFDGCCSSDGCRDLATALAHLFWQVVRRPDQRADLQRLEEALLAGYRNEAPGTSVEALDWWRAVALLQLATRRYRRLEISDWPHVPALVDAAMRLTESWESRSAATTGANLLDVHTMSDLLSPFLGRSGPPTEHTAIESAQQLAAAEGRRVVVSYAIRNGADRPSTSLVAKAFTDLAKAQLLHQHLRLLHDGAFPDADPGVPEPLGLLPEQRLVLLRGVTGTPLSVITDPEGAADGARRAGRWLARLHASGVPLPRRWSLLHEVEVARAWSDAIRALHPQLGQRAAQLALGWSTAVAECAPDQQVPLHKDFHAGHVLIGDSLCVVDLDEARLGDPAFDVAHFTTYLEAAPTASDWTGLRDAFLESYVEHSGWRDQGSYAPYCAYTWLKIAKQRALGRGPFPAVAGDAREELVASAITEGQRWLG